MLFYKKNVTNDPKHHVYKNLASEKAVTLTRSLALLLSIVVLTSACQKNTDGTTSSKKDSKTAEEPKIVPAPFFPQKPHSNAFTNPKPKQNIPSDWPKEVPIAEMLSINSISTPETRQTDQKATKEDNLIAQLSGTIPGSIRQTFADFHNSFLTAGWKSEIVIPQGQNAIMQYAKENKLLVVDLNQHQPNTITVELGYSTRKTETKQKKK